MALLGRGLDQQIHRILRQPLPLPFTFLPPERPLGRELQRGRRHDVRGDVEEVVGDVLGCGFALVRPVADASGDVVVRGGGGVG
jgi:hypothetical protein